MAKAIELGLQRGPEMFSEIPDSKEGKNERPDFDQIGAENLKWASEKVKSVKDSIWGGLKRMGTRVMTAGKAAYSETKAGMSEAYSDIKQNVKSDIESGAKMMASAPARAEYAIDQMRNAADTKGMELHEGIVGMKDSVVEKFNDGIIQGGEFVEAKYQQVSSFAVESYKGLENRAASAFAKMSSRIEAASQRRKESRFRQAALKLQQARREMLEAAAEAGISL